MEKRNIVRNEKGFTLIEIIAVLVILGIMAAVAVPKFIGLQEEAKEKAVEAAIGAASSNVTLTFAEYLLKSGGVEPTGITDGTWSSDTTLPETVTLTSIETTVGDFTAGYEYADGDVTITLSAGPDWFDTFATANADKVEKTFKIN